MSLRLIGSSFFASVDSIAETASTQNDVIDEPGGSHSAPGGGFRSESNSSSGSGARAEDVNAANVRSKQELGRRFQEESAKQRADPTYVSPLFRIAKPKATEPPPIRNFGLGQEPDPCGGIAGYLKPECGGPGLGASGQGSGQTAGVGGPLAALLGSRSVLYLLAGVAAVAGGYYMSQS